MRDCSTRPTTSSSPKAGATSPADDGAGHTDTITTAAGANAGSVTLPVAGTYTIKDEATLLDTITVS